mmetsp:Transcript_11736/g.26562  ORF Transcript_11736/g.26562 Transcript_11736/m.26562 type:complete len:240 (+) Transcript_11736:769-1488(+)
MHELHGNVPGLTGCPFLTDLLDCGFPDQMFIHRTIIIFIIFVVRVRMVAARSFAHVNVTAQVKFTYVHHFQLSIIREQAAKGLAVVCMANLLQSVESLVHIWDVWLSLHTFLQRTMLPKFPKTSLFIQLNRPPFPEQFFSFLVVDVKDGDGLVALKVWVHTNHAGLNRGFQHLHESVRVTHLLCIDMHHVKRLLLRRVRRPHNLIHVFLNALELWYQHGQERAHRPKIVGGVAMVIAMG